MRPSTETMMTRRIGGRGSAAPAEAAQRNRAATNRARSAASGILSQDLIEVDVLEGFCDRLFLRLLEQLLKFAVEDLALVLLGFGDLLVFLVAARGLVFDELRG